MTERTRRRGFTLIELTMAIAVVALAVASMAQLLDTARRAARDDAELRFAGEVMDGMVERVRARDLAADALAADETIPLPAAASSLANATLAASREAWRGERGISSVTLELGWDASRGGRRTMRRVVLLRDGVTP